MDPYKVLGVVPDATDEEVKAAYHSLARKYHPDNYVNNPLADLAQEKMKQINEAYDMVQRQRKQGSSANARSYGSQGSYSSQDSGQFSDIRRLIMQPAYGGGRGAAGRRASPKPQRRVVLFKGQCAVQQGLAG